MQQPAMTVKELAQYLRVHPSTIYRLVKHKDIPHQRIGKNYRFFVDRIDEWRKEQEVVRA